MWGVVTQWMCSFVVRSAMNKTRVLMGKSCWFSHNHSSREIDSTEESELASATPQTIVGKIDKKATFVQ